jgi:HAD superfamily hydrolase (TIGR01509 family)
MHYKSLFSYFLGFAILAGISAQVLSLYSSAPTEQNCAITHKKHIIFDLGNVLIKTSTIKAFAELGIANILWYMTTTRTSPYSVSNQLRSLFYTVLASIEKADPAHHLIYDEHGIEIPELMYQWMTGKQSASTIRIHVIEEIITHPEWFISTTEQILIKNMTTMIFTPERFAKTRALIKGAHEFVQQCKDQGHTLYILSNWDPEAFAYMRDTLYPEFFALFSGAVISGNVGYAKPNSNIYKYFLQKFDLSADECLFIDDQKENVTAAQTCNIASILFVPSAHDTFESLGYQLA